MPFTKKYFLPLSAIALVVACGSNPDKPNPVTETIPDWVLNPVIEDGLVSTECVNWSGNMNIDKAQAVASARAEITKQIDVKVKAMDKTYARKTETSDKLVTSNVFESVSKQLAQQSLSGSRAEKVDIVKIAGKQQLCAMVTLKPAVTKMLFKDIIKSSGVQVSAQDESILFEEFKAHKAQQELEASSF